MTTKDTSTPDLTFRFDAADSTWAIVCNSDICDGRTLESGYRQFDWAVEESADHDCETEAVDAHNRHYGFVDPAAERAAALTCTREFCINALHRH